MRLLTTALLLLTLFPEAAFSQPRLTAVLTAYCLPGQTASGPKTFPRCIALSRPLRDDLGARFGDLIWVEGHGVFVFADLMPKKWTHYRVDIYFPTLRQCKVFGVSRGQVKVVAHTGIRGDPRMAVEMGKKFLQLF